MAGATGGWAIDSLRTVVGEPLPAASRLAVVESAGTSGIDVVWRLAGVVSSERYVTAAERDELRARQPLLGRSDADRAALIPIRKNDAWWSLAQDERRAIFQKRSGHVTTGLRALPAVARRLHHCRDLGEPFDFLTWFEYAQADAGVFEELVQTLRQTEEWAYVDREIDIRLSRS
ncbi:chlorite dismutase family protein [Micromonospora sp. KC723]|uniref:chlorite dismutase family protein n=1 Tax=Micromonospora sp. KC723 TaxID=2530381 RepID=UPI001FB57F04|nr:chlorite dismutase family protein [Micromonospora sp. KC723]